MKYGERNICRQSVEGSYRFDRIWGSFSSQVCNLSCGQIHTPETRVVQDADVLDHAGPIGLWLAFYWIATHEETIDDVLRYFHSEENARRLTRMRNALNFDISVKILDQPVEYERQFFAELGRAHREGL